MKNLKRLFALLLALAIMMSMAVTVSATGGEKTLPFPEPVTSRGTITILGSAAGTQYTIYRLFDIVQLDDTQNEHANAFKVRPEWASFVETCGYFTLSNGYVNAETLSTLTDIQKQTFADAAIKHAESNPTINFDGQSAKLLNSGNYTTARDYQYGYYIMTSNRTNADNFKYSIFTLDRPNVQVEEKTDSTVTLQKFVQEDSSTVDDGWTTENNAEIGQEVHFKIIVKVSAGEEPYVIEDRMPNFKEIGNWKFVYSNGDMKENYVTVEPLSGPAVDGLTTTIDEGVKITLTPTFRELMEDGNTVTITYTAKLKHTADTTTTGNPNTATLTYDAPDPLTASTVTRTNRLTVNKYDEAGNRLEDAEFSLSHNGNKLKFSVLDANTDLDVYVVDPLHGTESITTRGTGKFTICGLDTDDTYVLEEIRVPQDSNFIPMEPKNITITSSHNHHLEIDVVNVRGVDIPGTGGMGTTIFYIAGGLLTAAALILLVTKKRMSA